MWGSLYARSTRRTERLCTGTHDFAIRLRQNPTFPTPIPRPLPTINGCSPNTHRHPTLPPPSPRLPNRRCRRIRTSGRRRRGFGRTERVYPTRQRWSLSWCVCHTPCTSSRDLTVPIFPNADRRCIVSITCITNESAKGHLLIQGGNHILLQLINPSRRTLAGASPPLPRSSPSTVPES